MKREIKFRVWHKATKAMLNIWPYEWIKGHFAGTDKPNESFYNEFELTPDGNSCNRVTGKSVFITFDGQIIGVLPIDDKTTQSVNYTDEYELMQFTGLKDKNGKEIYEGDIVKGYGYEVVNGRQERPERKFAIKDFIKDTYRLLCITEGTGETIEVIGNIYENPELLK